MSHSKPGRLIGDELRNLIATGDETKARGGGSTFRSRKENGGVRRKSATKDSSVRLVNAPKEGGKYHHMTGRRRAPCIDPDNATGFAKKKFPQKFLDEERSAG